MKNTFKRIFRPWTYERKMFINDWAKTLPKGAKILDAGAGSCKYKPFFSHCDYKAQDFGAYDGEDHHIYGGLDYVSDVTDIPVKNASFDYLMSTEVLEHLPRPDLAVKEFSRILSAGGELILTAPMRAGIHMAPYHFYGGFTRYWYEHFLPKYGFEIVSIQENGKFFRYYGAISQQFLRKLTPKGKIKRIIFAPFKLVLSLWFRLFIPVVGFVLDEYVYNHAGETNGYFVKALKIQ